MNLLFSPVHAICNTRHPPWFGYRNNIKRNFLIVQIFPALCYLPSLKSECPQHLLSSPSICVRSSFRKRDQLLHPLKARGKLVYRFTGTELLDFVRRLVSHQNGGPVIVIARPNRTSWVDTCVHHVTRIKCLCTYGLFLFQYLFCTRIFDPPF
jgi:hypothetical protein